MTYISLWNERMSCQNIYGSETGVRYSSCWCSINLNVDPFISWISGGSDWYVLYCRYFVYNSCYISENCITITDLIYNEVMRIRDDKWNNMAETKMALTVLTMVMAMMWAMKMTTSKCLDCACWYLVKQWNISLYKGYLLFRLNLHQSLIMERNIFWVASSDMEGSSFERLSNHKSLTLLKLMLVASSVECDWYIWMSVKCPFHLKLSHKFDEVSSYNTPL